MDAFFSADPFIGGDTVWEGEAHEGTGLCQAIGKMNKNGWHGFEAHRYDFGELGSFELWVRAKTVFEVVEPTHRWHKYTAIGRITGGTGAFAEADGVFHFEGYTEFWFPPPRGEASMTAHGMIYGIEVPVPE